MTLRHLLADGVRSGFEHAAQQQCSGSDDPEERCPMRPQDGCVCFYLQWRRLPWWKRIFVKEPQRPTQEDALEMMFRERCRQQLGVKTYKLLGGEDL